MLKRTDCLFFKRICGFKNIMIFGAGENGYQSQQYCEGFGKKVACYLISDSYDISEFHGVPVKHFKDISEFAKKNSLVIIGRSMEHHNESVALLNCNGFSHIIPGISEITTNMDAHVSHLQEIYGDDIVFHIPEYEFDDEISMRIYAVTSATNFHATKGKWNSKYVEYIQAGAALTDVRICEITDDLGDNISKLNRFLNETTAGYWIAKNDFKHEYLGLYHYGRGMDLNDSQLKWIVKNDIDIVLKKPEFFSYDILSFSAFSGVIAYEGVKKFAEEYIEAAEKHLKDNIFFQGNIQIAKSEIFKEYYDWAIGVIMPMFEIYKQEIEIQPRLLAFAMESMLNIWCLKNADRFRFAFADHKSMALS